MHRVGLLSTAVLFVLLTPASSFAHYSFPCTQEEKDEAVRIERAVRGREQASVATLTGLRHLDLCRN